jgi:DNA-binding transcriptional LysR family regulator
MRCFGVPPRCISGPHFFVLPLATATAPRDLAQHECLLCRDPITARPFPWEFHRAGKVVEVKVCGKLILNDLATKLTACAAGHGIAQTIEFGLGPFR